MRVQGRGFRVEGTGFRVDTEWHTQMGLLLWVYENGFTFLKNKMYVKTIQTRIFVLVKIKMYAKII